MDRRTYSDRATYLRKHKAAARRRESNFIDFMNPLMLHILQESEKRGLEMPKFRKALQDEGYFKPRRKPGGGAKRKSLLPCR